VVHRLLNSNTDPQRIICSLPLARDLQHVLQEYLQQIWAADDITALTHVHGRALGLGQGLGCANAISPTQFRMLADAFTRAFEDRLTLLTMTAPALGGWTAQS
jgi:hypothetical protein